MATTVEVTCPKCGAAIPITEALTRPVLEAERARLAKEAAQRSEVLDKRENEIDARRRIVAEGEAALKKQQGEIDRLVEEQLASKAADLMKEAEKMISTSYEAKLRSAQEKLSESETKRLRAEKAELAARKEKESVEEERRNIDLTILRRVAEETDKIKAATRQEQEREFEKELKGRDEIIAEKDRKLRQAEKAELEVRAERRAMEESKRSLELEVQRRVDQERQQVREATKREEQESYRLKLAEKDKAIEDTKKKLDEAQRKIEQGSQQLQGEVAEVDLENLLRSEFKRDQFEPVAPGKPGGDLIHTVITGSGVVCGKIPWERKRTKGWVQDWLAKNRADQRDIGAHMGVIVTLTLPPGLETFDHREGVWIVASNCTLPLAKALRHTLIETANARTAEDDRSSKKEVMYAYVTGQKFRQRVQGLVEAYVSMSKDLEAEKRAMTRLWAKRESEIELLIVGAAGMYGDFQGIVGKSLPEIEQLKLPGEGAPLELTNGENVDSKNRWEF